MCMYVCVSHLECTNKEGSSVKEKKGWFPLECEFLLLFSLNVTDYDVTLNETIFLQCILLSVHIVDQ